VGRLTLTSLQENLNNLGEEQADELRKSGIHVFAGDQTAYGRIGGIHVVPFIRNGTTWMHASPIVAFGASDRPSDIILRPTPEGTLDEICAFKANLPL